MQQVWLVSYFDDDTYSYESNGPFASLEAIEEFFGVSFYNVKPTTKILLFTPTKNGLTRGRDYQAVLWDVEGS